MKKPPDGRFFSLSAVVLKPVNGAGGVCLDLTGQQAKLPCEVFCEMYRKENK